ncbi:hypothetical protein PybrP1_010559 [[Pythium] brassicae (nom. inval.)]|nr:hypothetical protein PybrP1_010559 [[Pythium] brassicae (nom. inval.)]
MDAMEAKMLEWRKKVPSKRQLTASLGKLVQQKSVAVLYTPSEQERIRSLSELVARATSDYERGEHWDRILAVVDALTNTSNRAVLKESVRYLRLRLGDPSPRVVILALTLTEAVVKNCGHLVHLEIATEAFMDELEDLHKAWGEAFLPYRHDYPLFIDTYHNMRKKGVKFPDQYDETKVPVLTPPPEPTRRAAEPSSVSSASSALAGLSPSELFHVATNIVDMFEDMLHEAAKEQSSISSHGVIRELAQQARELVQRMEGVIQSAVADGSENLESYLTVNDNLHAALKKYDALASTSNQRDESADRRRAAQRNSLTGGNNQHENDGGDDDDDPFAEFVDDDDDDDDPFASFVQQRAAKILGSGVDAATTADEEKPAVEKNLIDLWDDEPVPSNQSPVAPPTPQLSNLWLDDDLLAPPPAVAPATSGGSVPSAQPLIDDLWGDAFVTPSPVTAPLVVPATVATSAPDPFDFFNTASTTSTAQPAMFQRRTPAQPMMANQPFGVRPTNSAAPTNPFDLLTVPAAPVSSQPTASAQHQQPLPRSQPMSFNPFDF